MEWGGGGAAREAEGTEPQAARGRRATSTRPTTQSPPPTTHRPRRLFPPPPPHTPRQPHTSRPRLTSPPGRTPASSSPPEHSQNTPVTTGHAQERGRGGPGPHPRRDSVRDTARSSPQPPATPRATLDNARQRGAGRKNTPTLSLRSPCPPGHGSGRARPAGQSPVSLVNDPSAGSPTETLLRLLLPLDSQVRPSSQRSARAVGRPRRGRSEGLTKPSNR